jgi:glutaredoxin
MGYIVAKISNMDSLMQIKINKLLFLIAIASITRILGWCEQTPLEFTPPKAALYYLPYCPYSQEVLHYLKQIHKTVILKNVSTDPSAKKELKLLGGQLRVPCLIVDDKVIYGSAPIIQWLSENKDLLINDSIEKEQASF